MVVFKLKKKVLSTFLWGLNKSAEVYAPIKTDITDFNILKKDSKIDLSRNSYFPIKGHFFKSCEVIFRFNNNTLQTTTPKVSKKIFFGVRRCDLNAIKHQDLVFIENNKDPFYKKQRDNSVLIGHHCNKAPSEYCFCESMDLRDFYDLMFFDKGNYFLVDVKTQKGKELIQKNKKFFEKTNYNIQPKDKKIKTRKLKKRDFNEIYDHKDWEKGVNKCISCAACTTMCPTCYCYELCDKTELKNPKKGERVRKWSSCQLKSFTRVAGGHIFRESREERFKHRIYHQIQYFRQKNGIDLCVGCGRCIAWCPTKIDWVKMVNEMR